MAMKIDDGLEYRQLLYQSRSEELRVARWLSGGVQPRSWACVNHAARINYAEQRLLEALDNLWEAQK
jgi:hypothetical protein